MTNPYVQALDELGAVMSRLDNHAVEHACRLVEEADKIVLHGLGREGLQVKGFCMRLFHMWLNVSMVGDMTTPHLGPGDLFVVSSGPGALATAGELMKIARGAGAAVLLITAQPEAALRRHADHLLVLPAQTMADDQGASASRILPMGSAFEGALFVVFEVMVAKLKEMMGITAEDMRTRHTNME
ncbi:MAG: SIS domain-containing protein [Devosia sp.]|nr:SIS domain-containing protein [Devosia sp.]